MSLPTTPLSEFLPYVLNRAPKVPEPIAEFYLRLAAIAFCERTRCWRHIVTTPVSAENTTLVAPDFSTIHEFEEATHDGRPLIPTQYTDTRAEALYGERTDGPPTYITQTEPGIVAIFPYAPGTLRLSVFLKPQHGRQFGTDPLNPLRDALNVVPPFLLSQHAEAIANGALARILSLPQTPYSDPAGAQAAARDFETAVSTAFSSNIRGQQRVPLRVKPNFM